MVRNLRGYDHTSAKSAHWTNPDHEIRDRKVREAFLPGITRRLMVRRSAGGLKGPNQRDRLGAPTAPVLASTADPSRKQQCTICPVRDHADFLGARLRGRSKLRAGIETGADIEKN